MPPPLLILRETVQTRRVTENLRSDLVGRDVDQRSQQRAGGGRPITRVRKHAAKEDGFEIAFGPHPCEPKRLLMVRLLEVHILPPKRWEFYRR
jgi:hypothetical protein